MSDFLLWTGIAFCDGQYAETILRSVTLQYNFPPLGGLQENLGHRTQNLLHLDEVD